MRLPLITRAAHERALFLARSEERRETAIDCATQSRAMVAAHAREIDRLTNQCVRDRNAKDECRSQISRAEARFDALLARYHMLRLQGASEAPAAPAMPERPTPDPVTTAINEASAGKDAKVRKAMLDQVKRDRKAEMSDGDIILRIQRGNRPAEEVE